MLALQRPIGAIAMSMQSVASPAITVSPPKRDLLAHIPGDEGWPVIGRTLAILADPKGEVERMAAKYGPVYRAGCLEKPALPCSGRKPTSLCCSIKPGFSLPPMAGKRSSVACFRAA